MPFDGGSKSSRPIPLPPVLAQIKDTAFQEKERRRLAMMRSNTLLTKGLLIGEPSILYPQIFGKKSKLGE